MAKFHKIKLWISIASFMFTLGLGMYMNILPLYIKEITGDAATVGVVFGINNISRAIVTLIAGYLTYRIMLRRLFLIGWIFAVLGGLAYATIPTTLGVLLGATLMGLSNLSPTARSSMLLMLAPSRDEFSKAMFTISASFSTGFIIGPPIGGWMVDTFGWKSVFFTFSALVLLGAILLRFNLPEVEPVPVKSAPISFWETLKKYTYPFLFITFVGFTASLLRTTGPLWFQDELGLSRTMIGTYSSLLPISSLLISTLTSKWGVTPQRIIKMVSVGFLLSSLLILIPHPYIVPLFYFLRGGSFILLTISMALMGTITHHEDTGKVMGLTGTLLALGSSAGMWLSGIAYDISPIRLFIASAVFSGILIILRVPTAQED